MAVKPASRGSYETGNSFSGKTWHVSSHIYDKGSRGKGVIYTGTYAPREDRKKRSGRKE